MKNKNNQNKIKKNKNNKFKNNNKLIIWYFLKVLNQMKLAMTVAENMKIMFINNKIQINQYKRKGA